MDLKTIPGAVAVWIRTVYEGEPFEETIITHYSKYPEVAPNGLAMTNEQFAAHIETVRQGLIDELRYKISNTSIGKGEPYLLNKIESYLTSLSQQGGRNE